MKYFLLLLCSCGDLFQTPKPAFMVKMIGTSENPSSSQDPIGSAEPITQNYGIESIVLLDSSGGSVSLSSEHTDVRISDRILQIFKKNITTAEVGTSYTGIKITLNQTVSGTSRYEKNHQLNLTDEERVVTLTQNFKVLKGKNVTFYLYVKWRHTITRDDQTKTDSEMGHPGFRMTFEQ